MGYSDLRIAVKGNGLALREAGHSCTVQPMHDCCLVKEWAVL